MKKPAGGGAVDGPRAHQIHLVRSEQEQKLPQEVRARRDDLDLAIAKLLESNANLLADEYYRRLENLMRELAELYSARTVTH